MARYDILEAGFSSLDETINFGKRAVGDTTNLYEIVTAAVIRSSETNKTSDSVKIDSQYQKEQIFFSTDRMLRIIKDKEITDEIGSFEFDYVIDTFCVSLCGNFILICTRDGTIIIKTLPSQLKNEVDEVSKKDSIIVFEEKLEDFSPVNEYFIGSFFNNSTFYIVTSSGLVKKILLNTNDDGNLTFQHEIMFDLGTKINICAFEYPYLCVEGNELHMLNVKNGSCQTDDAVGFKNLHAVQSYFFAYDILGNMYKIRPNELIIFLVNGKFPDLVNNFDSLLHFDDDENKSQVYFLGTTKGLTQNNKTEIQLIAHPGSDVVYSLPVEGPVHLLNVKDPTEDVLCFTEIYENFGLSEIRLQAIVKADPRFRLTKLIQRGLLDEAEKFAKTFNISPEIIAQAKARDIITKSICNTDDVNQLLEMLDTINDQMFKLECCDVVNCELGSDTRRVLCYGAFLDITVKDNSQNKDDIQLIKKMDFNDKLHRFDTFMELYENYDHNKWKLFADCDLINEIIFFIDQEEIEKASVIYSRLDRKTLHELTPLTIEDITIMLNKDCLTKTSFLNTFIPISLKHVPCSIVIFVEWLHERVLQLENQHGDFPECALKFVTDVTKLMNSNSPVKQQFPEEHLQELAVLIKALEDLKFLLNNFGIRFSLSEYLTNPLNIIKMFLNTNNDAEHFEALMKEFVCPFISNRNLGIDLLLMEEIENLLVYEEEYWISMFPVLLKFITSIDLKLDLIDKILEITHIPWSDSVKNIAQSTCQLAPDHPVAERISDHIKNEQILIILRKYDINKTHFETLDDKMFCFNRMIYLNRPTVFEDIHRLCIDDEIRHKADVLLIGKLIMRQNTEEAIKILDENNPEKIISVGKEILNRCLFYATCFDMPKKYRDAHDTILNSVWNRLKKHGKDLYNIHHLECDYKVAKAIYGINGHFKIEIDITDLVSSRKKDNLLSSLVQQIIDSLGDDIFDFETFMLKCKKLSQFFDVDMEAIFMKCLLQGKNLNPFLKLGQHVLDTSSCSQLLACWALYLLKYIKSSLVNDFEESLSDVFLNVSENHEDYLEGIKLARKLSIKAMMNATSEDHLAVMEVIRWVNTCFYLTNNSKDFNVDALQIYCPSNALSQIAESVEAIKSTFNIYCAALGSSRQPNVKYFPYFALNISVSEDQFINEMKQLTWNINTLLREGQHLTCFNVIKTLQQGLLCNSNISKNTLLKLQSIVETVWLPKTLEAVLSYKHIDKVLLFNLMLLCDKNEKQLWNYLQVYKRQPNKLSVITQVGLELLKHNKNTQGEADLKNNLNLCKWWNKVTNINYEFFFTAGCEDRMEALILAKQLPLGNLPQYCSDFGLELQESYLKYLEIILKCWQPKYNKISDVNGKTSIVFQNSESELEEECQNILELITDTDSVLVLISNMWPLINFYYYEVFMVLLSINAKLSTTKSTFEAYEPLLLFLKGYKRVSSPSRSETEKWYGSFSLKAFIDPLSEFRLPLTSTFFSTDIWTIIKSEVNLDTYKDWFKIVPILNQFLNENDICTYAINSALPSGLSSNPSNSWELYPKYDHVIAKVEECVKNITDLERATAAVYTLMCNMSPGADKVRMAELSYQYAQMYKETATTDVKKVYIKVKQRYFNYSAIHILYKYQIAEDELLKLVVQPLDLISKLYDDTRIPKKICSVYSSCPDINKAVDELCVLFGFTTKKIKFSVLLKFLKSDSTLDLDNNAENDCLLRAYYICSNTDFHKYLLKIGMNKDDTESTTSLRANALKCLYYSGDIESIQTAMQMTCEEFLTYTTKMAVIAKLEDLGLKLKTVEELDQFNRKKLLRKLAEINTPLGIQCIAIICKIYGLDDVTYWEYIINSAIRFNLITDLRDYVEYLRFRCVTDFIKRAWNTIVADAFKTEANLISTLKLIQTCPVIYALTFEDYVETCLSYKRPEIAAILLQYIPAEKHKRFAKVILAKEHIFENIAGLKVEGVLGTDKVIRILNSSCKLGN